MAGPARTAIFFAISCVAACSALVDLSGLRGGPDASLDGETESSVLGGASRCTLSSFSLCDDFERGAIAPGVWSFVSPNPPTIDPTRSARGSRSARIHFEGNDGSAQLSYLETSVTLLLPARSAFARAFVYVPSSEPTPDTGVVWLISGTSGGAVLGTYQGKLRMLAAGGAEAPRVSATPVPLDRWACLELEVFAAGDAGVGGARA
ncbi:MAG TPA: hypothetical protein VGH87_02785, partial [Polyangiaceae bacterium]